MKTYIEQITIPNGYRLIRDDERDGYWKEGAKYLYGKEWKQGSGQFISCPGYGAVAGKTGAIIVPIGAKWSERGELLGDPDETQQPTVDDLREFMVEGLEISKEMSAVVPDGWRELSAEAKLSGVWIDWAKYWDHDNDRWYQHNDFGKRKPGCYATPEYRVIVPISETTAFPAIYWKRKLDDVRRENESLRETIAHQQSQITGLSSHNQQLAAKCGGLENLADDLNCRLTIIMKMRSDRDDTRSEFERWFYDSVDTDVRALEKNASGEYVSPNVFRMFLAFKGGRK